MSLTNLLARHQSRDRNARAQRNGRGQPSTMTGVTPRDLTLDDALVLTRNYSSGALPR